MIHISILFLAFSLMFCGEQKPPQQDSIKAPKSKMTITQVLEKYTDEWMKIPGVIGTGQSETDGKPSITVFVDTKTDVIEKKIPETVEGFKVVIEVTGEIKALE